jgi:hypothetical protein
MRSVVLVVLLSGCGDKETDTAPAVDTGPVDTGTARVICEVTLPANTWVISDNQYAGAAGAIAWVCGGGELDISAPGGVFVVEAGGSISINAADGLYYAKNNAAVALNVSGVEIFHEQLAAITVNSIGTLTYCDEIVVDSSAVPLGCD